MTALSQKNLAAVLNSTELILGYMNVLGAIIEWRKVHPEEPTTCLDELYRLARFEALTAAELKFLAQKEVPLFSL